MFKVEAQHGVLFVSTVSREIRRNRWVLLNQNESYPPASGCSLGNLEQWPANHVAPACFEMFGYISGPVTTAHHSNGQNG